MHINCYKINVQLCTLIVSFLILVNNAGIAPQAFAFGPRIDNSN